MKDQKNKR